MAWKRVGQLHSAEISTLPATAGGTFAIGDPLVWSTGKLIKKTGGTNTVKIKYLAEHAAVLNDSIYVVPLTADCIVEAPYAGTAPTVGGQYGIDTDLKVDSSNTTQVMVEVISVDTTAGTCRFIPLGWAA